MFAGRDFELMKHGLASKGRLNNDVSRKGFLLESMEGTVGKE